MAEGRTGYSRAVRWTHVNRQQ